jgi:acyl-coenzyme A synthetase/AMP-(fatty) acid ligase
MYGLGAEFLPAVLVGASIDLQDRTNLLKYLEREKHFQPTIAFVTPTICDMLLKGFRRPRTNYKVIVTSGQRIGETLFRAFDERVNGCLVNQYGSSEMGAIAACDPGDPLDLKATTIGRPMSGVQLSIYERSDGATGVDDGTGELHCQHPYGFLGYVDEAGSWLYQATPDQWYSTSDLARPLSDGSIQVVGRAGNSVNRRGYLVQFAEIEQQMEKMTVVEQAIVVRAAGTAAQEDKSGERIAAFCVLNPAAGLTTAQLRQDCFDRLPNYAIPDDIFIMETLPLLPSGKVDRQALVAITHNTVSERKS